MIISTPVNIVAKIPWNDLSEVNTWRHKYPCKHCGTTFLWDNDNDVTIVRKSCKIMSPEGQRPEGDLEGLWPMDWSRDIILHDFLTLVTSLSLSHKHEVPQCLQGYLCLHVLTSLRSFQGIFATMFTGVLMIIMYWLLASFF